MITCAEALIPLAFTAIFTTGGAHNSQHAKWGENKRVVVGGVSTSNGKEGGVKSVHGLHGLHGLHVLKGVPRAMEGTR